MRIKKVVENRGGLLFAAVVVALASAGLFVVLWSRVLSNSNALDTTPPATHAPRGDTNERSRAARVSGRTSVNRQRETAEDAARARLIAALEGAYPAQATPSGTVREVPLVAAESEVELVPGLRTRVWTYNGKVPGPEIRVRLGDTLRIHFTNNLPQPTTIHFHGVRVPNAMDGVPGVTQDPVPPGGSFTYEFTPKDAGTFWFHPHVRGAEQLERGLYGTLIVEDANPLPYHRDLTWVIDDWRLDARGQVAEPWFVPHDLMHDGRWGNVIAVNGSTTRRLVVRAGERLRLRLVNASNARSYRLSLLPAEGAPTAEVQVIAVDGMYVRTPFPLTSFEFAPGNRVDLDVSVPLTTSGARYVLVDSFGGKRHTLATIEVAGAVPPSERRTFLPPRNPLVPRWEEAAALPPDKVYVLERRMSPMMMRMGGMFGTASTDAPPVWTINGKAWPDYDPISLRAHSFNKFVFRNDSPSLHPMHLHGQFFKVLSRNGTRIEEPFFRDTVLVYPGEEIEVGLVPYDRGRWAQHCHIQMHADAGMMTVVEVQ